ncbi:MAG: DUF5723 family protein [Brumimicrobium sp.]|nr:DUF5723 family protein [Brumimicrobium sp.]
MKIINRCFSIFFVLILLISPQINAQQQYTGYSSDNFNGYLSSYLNPASIANSVNKFSFTGSFVYLRSNNYLGQNSSNLSLLFGNEQERYRDHRSPGYNMNNFSADIVGAYFEINHENSIGYSLRLRQFGNVDGLPNELTKAKDNNFNNTKPLNSPIDFTAMNFVQFVYSEHRFHYARVMHNSTPHFLKAGIAVKLINGIDATYLYADEGSFEFTDPNGSSANFNGTTFRYGRAEKDNSFSSRRLGFGLDFGAEYEYRPNPEKYKYDMDGKTGIERYDQKKYLFKLGASITDIGRVRFSKDTSSYDFINNGSPIDVNDISSLGVGQAGGFSFLKNFDGLASAGTKSPDNEEKFNMNLPTLFNLYGDYYIGKNFYASWTSSIPLKRKRDPHKAHFKAVHTLTPRYEISKVTLMTPITFQRNAQINFGLAGRLELKEGISFFMGGNNISGFLGKRSKYTRNLFGGIICSVPYKIPDDTDKDKVSDAIDKCMYDPGPFSLMGCPDTDNDGIPDIEDHCIFTPGTREHHGCPDTDKDGIIDLNDQCPEEPGLPIHYGCPDRDKDGIIDAADRCPDEPGIELNNGCPFEMPKCCTDDDGDGFPNDLDACPDVPGSVYNNGCPIDSTNLEKIELKEIKKEKDPNHTEEKVEEIKEIQKPADKDETVGTMRTEPYKPSDEVERLSIYFNTDDATVKEEYDKEIRKLAKKYKEGYRFVVIGHTDSQGSETYNLILSKKRAEVVGRKLTVNEIDDSQIEIYYFGEWKPMKSEDNKEYMQFNRRVEIIVEKKKN